MTPLAPRAFWPVWPKLARSPGGGGQAVVASLRVRWRATRAATVACVSQYFLLAGAVTGIFSVQRGSAQRRGLLPSWRCGHL
jgi:hypothetical protein